MESTTEGEDVVSKKRVGQYVQIIRRIFFKHYEEAVRSKGKAPTEFSFEREEIATVAKELHAAKLIKKERPGNLGDVVYHFRHRQSLPEDIVATQPQDKHWIILGDGFSRYRFRLSNLLHVIPNKGQAVIPILDATPEITAKYALSDEQALLAKIRYNRLIDTFLGITAYSLQNHLRTTIPNYGQIEIDELYVGIDKEGDQYVVPVQAKGPRDKLGVIQTIQDVTYCKTTPAEREAAEIERNGGKKKAKKKTKEKPVDFTHMKRRAVSAQLLEDGAIAMFLLDFDGLDVTIKETRHYRLVPADYVSTNAPV